MFRQGGTRGRRGSNVYTMMLLYRLWERINELEHKPPVTIGLIAFNIAIFAIGSLGKDVFGLMPPDLQKLVLAVRPVIDVRAACILPSAVVGLREFRRLVVSAFVHVVR